MATTHDPEIQETGRASRAGWRRFRWTSKQYYRIAELGYFQDRRVELVGGEIWTMTTSPPRSIASNLVSEALRIGFGPGHVIRVQQPLDRGRHNQPEPDLAVVAGNPRDLVRHPTTALLIVEICDSTLRRDRTIKAHLYAHAGIADYWIVNLNDRQLEIYRNPGPDPDRKGRFRYAEVTIVPADGHAVPLAKPDARISVADLLP